MRAGAVVFDLGGVVFHWQPLQLIRQVFTQRVRSDEDAVHLRTQIFQGHAIDGDWTQWDMGRIDRESLARRIAQRTGLTDLEMLAFIDAIAPHLQVKTDTLRLMDELKAAGHRLLYLSNMPRELARWIESVHPFDRWFEDGIFSARVGLAKPDEAIYRHAIERLGLHDQETVFLDDTPPNLVTARRLGWQALHFESAQQARDQILALGLLD